MGTANKTRKKFEEEVPELKDKVFRIEKIRFRKIGHLVPASGGLDYYSGGYEYEPGYLQDEKTIKVLGLTTGGLIQSTTIDIVWQTTTDIDATYVEKIVQHENKYDVTDWIKRYYNVLSIGQKYDAFKFLITTGLQDKAETIFYNELEEFEERSKHETQAQVHNWFRNRELEIQQFVLQKVW